jgi:hypothetical protein
MLLLEIYHTNLNLSAQMALEGFIAHWKGINEISQLCRHQ